MLVSPSGGGKSTIAKRLFIDFKNLKFSVSATTRAQEMKKPMEFIITFFQTPISTLKSK